MQSSPKFSVLLVEDDATEAALISEALNTSRYASFTIEHQSRLQRGIEVLGRNRFDIVLLDLNLPDGSGLANLAAVNNASATLPVVILTNVSDEATALKAVQQGAQDYLVKSQITSELLSRAIRYAVARNEAEIALRQSEERYSLAIRGAQDGLWDWDLVTHEVFFSTRWYTILGQEVEESPSIDSWLRWVHPEDDVALRKALDEHLAGETGHFEHEYRMVSGSGKVIWVMSRGLAIHNDRGLPVRIAGSLTDITRRKEAEAKLVHDAMHDELTGLPNRHLFLDRVENALNICKRDDRRGFAVLFLDLDRFKRINDSLGHGVGDILLKESARRLKTFLRPGDSVARMGGDEFAVLLAGIADAQSASIVAERIQDSLSTRFVIDQREIYTSVSIGIALGDARYESATALLRDADLAMYRIKHGGAGAVAVFDQEMHRRECHRLELETDLRRGVKDEDFEVYYQPIVSLEEARIIGFEALCRWHHPRRGLIGPEEFIPIAEDIGLVDELSWWVLREACRQTKVWQRQFEAFSDISISVNISSNVLSQVGFADRVEEVLTQTDLGSRHLHLEITENALLDHREAVLAELNSLRKLGVQLHLDDFGTGYSSLSYLNLFPYDSIKIDRSFVSSLHGDSDGNQIVNALISLSRNLNMKVIAEGVETREQAEWLRTMSCPNAQGYWFSRPVTRESAASLLVKELDTHFVQELMRNSVGAAATAEALGTGTSRDKTN